MKRNVAALTLGLSLCACQSQQVQFDTESFQLVRQGESFALNYSTPSGVRVIDVPRDLLFPPAWRYLEREARVTPFAYAEPVTAFDIGNGVMALHVSSYAVHAEGSVGAAAGRDVFLHYDTASSTLSLGVSDLGITKARLKYEGCHNATMQFFYVSDVNEDELLDLGAKKEQIICEEVESPSAGVPRWEPETIEHPIRWYVFADSGWVYSPERDGFQDRRARQLPLIELVKTPVQIARELNERESHEP